MQECRSTMHSKVRGKTDKPHNRGYRRKLSINSNNSSYNLQYFPETLAYSQRVWQGNEPATNFMYVPFRMMYARTVPGTLLFSRVPVQYQPIKKCDSITTEVVIELLLEILIHSFINAFVHSFVLHSFIHSFIHYKQLCSASSTGWAAQRRS